MYVCSRFVAGYPKPQLIWFEIARPPVRSIRSSADIWWLHRVAVQGERRECERAERRKGGMFRLVAPAHLHLAGSQ
jgi:hypothetical protein